MNIDPFHALQQSRESAWKSLYLAITPSAEQQAAYYQLDSVATAPYSLEYGQNILLQHGSMNKSPASGVAKCTQGEQQSTIINIQQAEYPTIKHVPCETFEWWRRLNQSGVAGRGGAGFSLQKKLHWFADQAPRHVVVNAIECDENIKNDDWLINNHLPAIQAATQQWQRHLSEKYQHPVPITIISKNKHQRIRLIQTAGVAVVLGDYVYPQGAERAVLATLQLVAAQAFVGNAAEHNILSINLQTFVWAAFAGCHEQPLLSRVITLNAKHQQTVRHLPLGVPLRALSIVGVAGRVGLQQADISFTTAIPLPPQQHKQQQPCVGCGACDEVCPAKPFSPQHALRRISAAVLEQCWQCGLCDDVCPSQIPLTEIFKQALQRQRKQHQDSQQAERYLLQHQLHQQRTIGAATRGQQPIQQQPHVVEKTAQQITLQRALRNAKKSNNSSAIARINQQLQQYNA